MIKYIICQGKKHPIDECINCKERKCKIPAEVFAYFKNNYDYKISKKIIPVTAIVSCPLKYYLENIFVDTMLVENIRKLSVGFMVHTFLATGKVDGNRYEVDVKREIENGIYIKGRIDKIDDNNKEIVDFKTGKFFQQEYLDQGLLYAWLLENKYKLFKLEFIGKDLEIRKVMRFSIEIFKERQYNLIERAKMISETLSQKNSNLDTLRIKGKCTHCKVKKLCREMLSIPDELFKMEK